MARRALVIGGGISGLGAAAALGRHGWEVDVVEAQGGPDVLGVGINQPANSLRALRELGVLDRVLAAGYAYDRNIFADAAGEEIVVIPSGMGEEGVPANCALSRRDLSDALVDSAAQAGVTTHYGTRVTDIDDHGDAVTVTLDDGSTSEHDLVVGCDGIKSPLRTRVFGPDHEPAYSGYGVWRYTCARPAGMDHLRVQQGVGAKAGLIPLSQDSMYLFLVTPEPEGVRQDPAALRTALAERLSSFGGWIGDVRDELASRDGSDGVVYTALNEVLVPTPWHRGRVLVIGDAVHACSPHLTQGAAMALEDGVVLADVLGPAGGEGSVDAGDARALDVALTAFSERRWPRVNLVHQASHGILMTEMAITVDSLPHAIEGMRAHLPEQMAGLDAALDRAA